MAEIATVFIAVCCTCLFYWLWIESEAKSRARYLANKDRLRQAGRFKPPPLKPKEKTMYQGEEARNTYEKSCRKKCCGKYGHAETVVSMRLFELEPAPRGKVIRIAFRDGNHVNLSCDGRDLRVVKRDDEYVILEDEKDANGKASLMAINQVAFFPCDVVQSIIRTTA